MSKSATAGRECAIPAYLLSPHPVAFDMGLGHAGPDNRHKYYNYRKLAAWPLTAYVDARAATRAAKKQFGPRARVLMTGRHWIAYVI